MLEKLAKSSKDSFDLTDQKDQTSLTRLVDKLLKEKSKLLEVKRIASKKNTPLEFRLAAKLYESKLFVNKNKKHKKIAIIFAMWGEQNRLRKKTKSNPNGEDALRTKLAQLDWLLKDSAIDWHLFAVDAQCPQGSGNIAEKILSDHPLADKATILYLKNALPCDKGPLSFLENPKCTGKGASIMLGCKNALDKGFDACIYTDADNSVHLGQIGLLLKPYLKKKADVVLGDRKSDESVLVKQEARWGPGVILFRHLQRRLAKVILDQGIQDTQAAFKLYDKKVLKKIFMNPVSFEFAFDTEWIMISIKEDEKIVKVPFAFIDSFEESASQIQGPMNTWLNLLQGLVRQLEAHNIDHDKEFAQIVKKYMNTKKNLQKLVVVVPPELEGKKTTEVGDPSIMPPAKITAWIKKVLG